MGPMPETCGCCLDLDHTILHMMKTSELPPARSASDLCEDVVPFKTADGVDYVVCVRVGATSLVTALREAKVKVVIVTCNLLGNEVMAALGERCDVFADLPVHIVHSRDKGAKSLTTLNLNFDRVVILDDSRSAWCAADTNFVFAADRFDVLTTLAADDDDLEDTELGYLCSIKDNIMGFFTVESFDWGDDDDVLNSPRSPKRRRCGSRSSDPSLLSPSNSSPSLVATSPLEKEQAEEVVKNKDDASSNGSVVPTASS